MGIARKCARMLHFCHSRILPAGPGIGDRYRERETGLTLVELLIAVALLGFILLGIAPLFIASVKANYSANEYTSIHMMARDRLEQLMNRTFLDPQLAPGQHVNDQATLMPDPTDPTLLSTVPNPFTITYTVDQYQIPAATGVANGASWTPTLAAVGQPYQYKRIDVTVMAHTFGGTAPGPFGIGNRVARVSGCISNPLPNVNLAVALCNPCP